MEEQLSKMKAIKIPAERQLQVVEIDQPAIGYGDVFLRVNYVGFCGSDLNTFLGKNPMVRMPVIPMFNESDENVKATAAFCEELGDAVTLVQLLPYHNLGVMHQVNAIHYGKGSEKWQSEMQSAVEAYKDALRNNPTDDQTRYNLVLCLRQLPKGNNDQNSTPPPPEQQQEQEQKDEEQQKNQNNDQQQQDQKQDQQQDQQQQDQQSENPDKDWMEQMINAAEQKERQTMRRLNEQKDKNQERAGQRRPLEKNW